MVGLDRRRVVLEPHQRHLELEQSPGRSQTAALHVVFHEPLGPSAVQAHIGQDGGLHRCVDEQQEDAEGVALMLLLNHCS